MVDCQLQCRENAVCSYILLTYIHFSFVILGFGYRMTMHAISKVVL